ncbi:Calcium-dependent protein kinase 27 [Holothuria leucospilota]|uniref:Calcium-dependent protein kinase 27 n=1 Tax=Holothuria leucospilota TaxID=206669 RepID=A0A9Q1CLQ5_HOLLE|nr:Calcium-dependent protein kinase 27 [Holothuria leucospilota]
MYRSFNMYWRWKQLLISRHARVADKLIDFVRRFLLNKLFWWFACLRPSEEDVSTDNVKEEASPAPIGISGDQTKENHQVSFPILSDLIDPSVQHLSSICSMLGLSDVPIILPEDLEDVEDSFGMPVFLGAGNYGTVQLMRSKSTRRLCAVKSQHSHINQQNFLREVRVLKALEGIENVPVFYGVTVAMDGGAIPAIVQEYIGNDNSLHATSLYDAIEKRSISEEQSLQLALQISRTVQDMHNRGWLHCDLKGDNILLQFEETSDENQWDVSDIDTPWEQCDEFAFTEISESTDAKINIKLIDFGLSCHVDDRQECFQYSVDKQVEILETCKHVSPEVVMGQSVFTSFSDVYALGLLFKDMSGTSRDFLN